MHLKIEATEHSLQRRIWMRYEPLQRRAILERAVGYLFGKLCIDQPVRARSCCKYSF
jgi:hypothetical protein